MFTLDAAETRALIRAMEDPSFSWAVSLDSGEVKAIVDPVDLEADPTLLPIPSWDAERGYLLRLDFAESCADPVAGPALREALETRQGAFKSFKNALEKFPAVEARFKLYRDRRLSSILEAWYAEQSAYSESSNEGLAAVGAGDFAEAVLGAGAFKCTTECGDAGMIGMLKELRVAAATFARLTAFARDGMPLETIIARGNDRNPKGLLVTREIDEYLFIEACGVAAGVGEAEGRAVEAALLGAARGRAKERGMILYRVALSPA